MVQDLRPGLWCELWPGARQSGQFTLIKTLPWRLTASPHTFPAHPQGSPSLPCDLVRWTLSPSAQCPATLTADRLSPDCCSVRAPAGCVPEDFLVVAGFGLLHIRLFSHSRTGAGMEVSFHLCEDKYPEYHCRAASWACVCLFPDTPAQLPGARPSC